jgi:hypothetical protein
MIQKRNQKDKKIMNKNAKNGRKSNKVNRNPKSMKGKKGTVGAPLKPMKFPKTAFTVKRIVEMNEEVCELTVRNRFNRMLKAGEIVRLQDKPQAGGAVGRPNRQYLLKVNVTKDTVLFGSDAPAAPSKRATRKSKTVVAVTVNEPTAPAPVVSTPTPDVVSLAPATPAPEPVAVEVTAPEAVTADVIAPVVPAPLP